MTASFIGQISSSENVLKRDAILAPVAKQWLAKDIPSYGSQSKRAKIAIHWLMVNTQYPDPKFSEELETIEDGTLHRSR